MGTSLELEVKTGFARRSVTGWQNSLPVVNQKELNSESASKAYELSIKVLSAVQSQLT